MKNNCITQIILGASHAVSVLCAVLVALASACIHAQTVTLNPVADTGIEQFSPTVNFGANNTAVSGALGTAASHEIRRMLLRFDLTGKIPAGAVISSVTLRVQVTRVPQQPANSSFGLRPLLQSWTETGATWNSRSPGSPWQTPGASGAADSAAAASSTVFVSGFGSYVFPSTPALIADVQGWLQNPSGNFGWLLVSADENSLRTARHFGTRENSSAPVLTITYSVPPLAITQQPQSQTVLEGTSVQFSVTASGAPPLNYQWRFQSNNIPGATNATFILPSAQLTNAGSYTVVVSNLTESVTSDPAVLTVNPIVLPTPVVNFLEPTNGARVLSNATVIAVVDASVSNSVISKVDFFLGTNLVGTAATAPFSIVLSNLAAGEYQLSARATAQTGTSNTAIITFTVFDALAVRITQPAPAQKFPLGTDILLQAAIPPTAGAVSNVSFFANSTLVGEASAPSFTLNWTPLEPGDFAITAVASDEFRETASSPPINVRVFIPESQPPTVRITSSPKTFARLTDPVVSLAGTASDDVGLDRVEVSANNGSFQTVVGTESWSAGITLAAGLNIIQVRSVDLAGNVSPIVTRFFTFVVDWPLAVQTQGEGTLKPNLSGQLLEIGKAYAIRAKPAPGNIFVRWIAAQVNSNSVTTNAVQPGAVMSFIMQSNLMLTAEFAPNPFLPVRGSYDGLMLNTNAPAPESSGTVSLQVGDSGAFSGRIVIQGKRFPVSGQFDSAGTTRFAIIRPGLTPIALSLQLDFTNDTDTITGSAADGSWTASLLANRNVFNAKSNPAPAGVVPFVFVCADESNQQGASGTAKISANGNVLFSGALNDGRAFSFGSILAKDGSAPFFALLTSGNEMLAGWIQFSPAVSGRIYWVLAATNGLSVPLDVK